MSGESNLSVVERMLLVNGYTIEIKPDSTKVIIAPDLKPLGDKT